MKVPIRDFKIVGIAKALRARSTSAYKEASEGALSFEDCKFRSVATGIADTCRQSTKGNGLRAIIARTVLNLVKTTPNERYAIFFAIMRLV